MPGVSEIRDLWLAGGAVAVVGFVLIGLLFVVNRAGLRVTPPVQEQLQTHINDQHKFIIQMNSDHREERKEFLGMIQSLDANVKANTDAIKTLTAHTQSQFAILKSQTRAMKPRERKPHDTPPTIPVPVRPDLWPAVHARYGAVNPITRFDRSASGFNEPSA